MMIRKLLTFSLIAAAVLYTSCLKPKPEYKPPEMVKEIVPGQSGNEDSDNLFELDLYDSNAEKPVISLETDEVLLNTIKLNLD